MASRHLLDIDSLTQDEFLKLLSYGITTPEVDFKDRLCAALLFEKPSNRTRHSMETAIRKLNGFAVTVRKDEVDMGQRESLEDVTRTLACYHSVIAARVFKHETLVKMAECLKNAGSSTSVINLLSDDSHPQQALADVLTIHLELNKRGIEFNLSKEKLGSNEKVKVVYVGDFNNVATSLLKALKYLNTPLWVCTPQDHGPNQEFIDSNAPLKDFLKVEFDLQTALDNADVVYTDTWISMGQEDIAQKKLKDFAGFTLDLNSMKDAKSSAIFMHCLPAHRGYEVTDDLIESKKSVVFQQAYMRKTAAVASLLWLFLDGNTGENKWP
jgi:ornithine carbamoyltransferase